MHVILCLTRSVSARPPHTPHAPHAGPPPPPPPHTPCPYHTPTASSFAWLRLSASVSARTTHRNTLHTTRIPAHTPRLHTAHTHIPTPDTYTHTRSSFAPRSHRPHTTHSPLPPTRTHTALSFAWLCLWATVSARPTPFRPRPRPHPQAHPTRTHPWCPPDTRSASRGTYTHTAHITPPPPTPTQHHLRVPHHTPPPAGVQPRRIQGIRRWGRRWRPWIRTYRMTEI